MPIRFRCPGCGKDLKSGEDTLGREVRCSGCQRAIALPKPDSFERLPWLRPAPAPAAARPDPARADVSATWALGRSIERLRLQGQVAALETSIQAKYRALGLAALETSETFKSTPEADRLRALDAEIGKLEEDQAATGGSSSLAREIRAEVALRVPDRDEALAQFGRHARADARMSGSADDEIKRLDQLLAERRIRLAAIEREGIGARFRSTARRSLLVASLLLGAVAAGYGSVEGLSRLDLAAGTVPVEIAPSGGASSTPQAPAILGDFIENADRYDDAVGLVISGYRITRPSGVVTELTLSTGTAFFISTEGHLITNAHVVENVRGDWGRDLELDGVGDYLAFLRARTPLNDESLQAVGQLVRPTGSLRGTHAEPRIWVLFGSRKYDAQLLDYQLDPRNSGVDLAILKIDRPGCHALPLSTLAEPRRTTRVVALGYPDFGMEGITEREISAQNESSRKAFGLTAYLAEESIPEDARLPNVGDGSIMSTRKDSGRLTHSATISHGNSGGPLVGPDGVVLGINTWGSGQAPGAFYSQSFPRIRAMIDAKVPGVTWK